MYRSQYKDDQTMGREQTFGPRLAPLAAADAGFFDEAGFALDSAFSAALELGLDPPVLAALLGVGREVVPASEPERLRAVVDVEILDSTPERYITSTYEAFCRRKME